jgi:hypothetical protein
MSPGDINRRRKPLANHMLGALVVISCLPFLERVQLRLGMRVVSSRTSAEI